MPDVANREASSIQVSTFLPHLRRFARALTGSQEAGDAYAAATIEAILTDDSTLDPALEPKTALFRVFNSVWSSTGQTLMGTDEPDDGRIAAARDRLSSLTPRAREAFLLRSLEDFDDGSIAIIMTISEEEARLLVETGAREIESGLVSNVLIIEDEAIIAIELQTLVEDLGHKVIGIARTQKGANHLSGTVEPDLVLADIHLADGSSGIDAVNDLMAAHGEVPVIFITAYPERLLTGERPEPTYLIKKPFKSSQVRAAIEQALFFRSTASIRL